MALVKGKSGKGDGEWKQNDSGDKEFMGAIMNILSQTAGQPGGKGLADSTQKFFASSLLLYDFVCVVSALLSVSCGK
jgi:hypothetical protein